ncbi:putative Zinc finger C2H2-type protein [Gigaspora margarita]|uniref:Putative Zinc finger C2H2-type protein n=1 Tax=Gigaspora margarita TaxID=4874 RepID=A0A8H3XCY7_GIGMA|nr:putative Zinc finger C2H2-type protein [Gigaspora margarita]
MNSFSVNTEMKPTKTVQYFPNVGEPFINGRFPQQSLDEHPSQVIEKTQRLVVKEEENAQSLSSDDQKEHSPTPSASKTTYTCHVCSKRYKHRNCLVKHLWEHHESWELCLKFNLTKHQQVQMMEAAQILVDLACIKQH